jgi:peptidoglycan/LPS O-acetylase OafA/YrhL
LGRRTFDFSKNNFDLIRLIAASEVAIPHSVIRLTPDQFPGWLQTTLALIPWVPIFFFLSGFLISRSWERSDSARDFFRNRALRLFPALWVCIAVSITAIFLTGYLATVVWGWGQGLVWIVGQGTVFQFWNPDFLRNFGVGVVNGSLWSVSVETQFYCVTPVMYWLLSGFRPTTKTALIGALAFAFASFNAFQYGVQDFLSNATGSDLAAKLSTASFLP